MSSTPTAPMRVLERSVYRGPHRYSDTPMIRIQLDLGALRNQPTDRLHGFPDRLVDAVPALVLHGCSLGRPGGFVTRMREGTWIGHVVEHVALALQNLAGDRVTRGKTRSVPGHPGRYNVMFAYRDEQTGLAAARMAIELVQRLLPRDLAGVEGLDLIAPPLPRSADDGPVSGLAALSALVAKRALGPTTRSLLEAAERRGIPVVRDDARRVLRLGTGSRQTWLQASVTSRTSLLAAETAGDKARTKGVLLAAGLPVPRGVVVDSEEAALAAARELGGPVVTKPLDGNHGRGVTLHLLESDEVRRGYAAAREHSRRVVVEQQLVGRDYRILVIDGRVVAAAERVPASVVGDGVSTVSRLVQDLNADPRRGAGHGTVLSRIVLDDDAERILGRQGLRLTSVPESGRIVGLRDAANLSAGGEAIDRTDDIHPSVAAAAVRAAAAIGLDVAGIDLITADIAEPLGQSQGGIVEVNAGPGFRMHLAPSAGQPRDVAGPVLDMLYPPGQRASIPLLSVTGSNGKSTVVRMLGHIYEGTGRTVGMTTTSGIHIAGRLVKAADASGPRSARTVLADPTVDVAVLETARGGIVREGLGYARADVGVVLNVTGDHLGLGGVRTLKELAEVKAVVVRAVRKRGTSVLNADDPLTLRMRKVARGRLALFSVRSLQDAPPELAALVEAGGLAATIERAPDGDWLVLHDDSRRIPVLPVAAIPATLGGAADFNVQNALAAALAAYAQGVRPEAIGEGLGGFESSFEQNPGRLNITTQPGFTVIVDYGHNPPALRALGHVLQALRADHDRVIGVVSTPGDRRDDDIREVGEVAGELFDELIFRELPDGRGRAAGGVVALLSDGAAAAGMPASRIRRIMDEREAMDAALRSAGPRDLVVLLPSDVTGTWRQVQQFRAAWALGGGS